MRVVGLAMVSTKTMRVCSRSAARTLSARVVSTRLTCTPKPSSVPSRLAVLPNSWSPTTRWSPLLSKVKNSAWMAAMPVAKLTVPRPPSNSVTKASSAAVVGVPWRA
jgi:hypothetical protein